jgi:hypothetical protein
MKATSALTGPEPIIALRVTPSAPVWSLSMIMNGPISVPVEFA